MLSLLLAMSPDKEQVNTVDENELEECEIELEQDAQRITKDIQEDDSEREAPQREAIDDDKETDGDLSTR